MFLECVENMMKRNRAQRRCQTKPQTLSSSSLGGTEMRWILGGIGCMAIIDIATVQHSLSLSLPTNPMRFQGAKDGLSLSALSMAFSALFVTGGVFNALRVYAFTCVGHSIVRRNRHALFANVL